MGDLDRFQISALEEGCRAIARATPESLTWEWDRMFTAALVAFDIEHAQTIRAALDAAMPSRFTVDSVSDAPDGVVAVVRSHGGLRPGQELWVRQGDHPLLYGAWWPWGGGARVSTRVGIASHDEVGDEVAKRALRSWFAIEGAS